MIPNGTDALEQALALHGTPECLTLMRQRSLPRELLLLLRIVAGDADAINEAALRASAKREVVIEAATLYIQQVLFQESADSYKVLGVTSDASQETIKAHYRWLMRWLHPDRHPERWEVVYSERVNRAWNSLNTQQRRLAYDAQSPVADHTRGRKVRVSPAYGLKRLPSTPALLPLVTGRAIRWLPVILLSGLATATVVLLSLLAWVQSDHRQNEWVLPEKVAALKAVGDHKEQADFARDLARYRKHVSELSRPVLPVSAQAKSASTASDAFAKSIAAADNRSEVSSTPAVVLPGKPQTQASVSVPVAVADAAVPAPSAVDQQSPVSMTSANSRTAVRPIAAQGLALQFPRVAQAISPVSLPSVSSHAAVVRPIEAQVPATQLPRVAQAMSPLSMPSVSSHAAVLRPIATQVPATQVPPVAQAMSPTEASPMQVAKVGLLPAAVSRESGGASADVNPEAHAQATANGASGESPAFVAIAGGISAQQAVTVVPRAFESAYVKGDLAQMMGLFAQNAVYSHGGIDAIRKDYDQLFRDTNLRELRLDHLKWVVKPDRIAGNGEFEARIRHNEQRQGTYVTGWIRIEAVPTDVGWKIQRLVDGSPE